jgi:hypothetical protein
MMAEDAAAHVPDLPDSARSNMRQLSYMPDASDASKTSDMSYTADMSHMADMSDMSHISDMPDVPHARRCGRVG